MIRAGELVHIIVSDDGSDGKSVFFIRQAQDLRRWHRVDHAAAREIRIRSENFQ